jgi:hypothetical protein
MVDPSKAIGEANYVIWYALQLPKQVNCRNRRCYKGLPAFGRFKHDLGATIHLDLDLKFLCRYLTVPVPVP